MTANLTEIPATEAQDPYLLSPAEQSALLEGHPWSRFAVLGDSIALGMGDPTEGYVRATWAERIAAALGRERDVTYLNLAKHGATAAEIRDGQLGAVMDFGPDLVASSGAATTCSPRSSTSRPSRARSTRSWWHCATLARR